MSCTPTLTLKNWAIKRASIMEIGPMDLWLDAGKCLTLLGPSGIGKTSLLLSILGYLDRTLSAEGMRCFGGKALAIGEIPEHALYLPQTLPFNPNWEVEAFLCRLPWGEPSLIERVLPRHAGRLRRVREVLQRLGISHRNRALVSELSGGEARRAALAQMFLLHPMLLVADEFVTGLDPGMASQILTECRQFVLETGATALFALQDVRSAMVVSDFLLILWPPKLDSRPWQICRGTSHWEMAWVYSLLCFTQWFRESQDRPAVKRFVAILRAAMDDASGSLHELLGDGQLAIVQDSGDLGPACQELQAVASPMLRDSVGLSFEPARFAYKTQTLVGLVFTHPKRMSRQMLAVAVQ